jgi:hypothetical protein
VMEESSKKPPSMESSIEPQEGSSMVDTAVGKGGWFVWL